tara:strand:+ start:338 stop:493 length:156 start_codon:yes stop_codon:yes gene_type:complete
MHEEPFDHWIIDDFFPSDKAQRITEDFPAYDMRGGTSMKMQLKTRRHCKTG